MYSVSMYYVVRDVVGSVESEPFLFVSTFIRPSARPAARCRANKRPIAENRQIYVEKPETLWAVVQKKKRRPSTKDRDCKLYQIAL